MKVPNIDLRDLIYYLLNSKITIEELELFKRNMLLEAKAKWLIQGNIKKETALEIVQMTNKMLNIDIYKIINKIIFIDL